MQEKSADHVYTVRLSEKNLQPSVIMMTGRTAEKFARSARNLLGCHNFIQLISGGLKPPFCLLVDEEGMAKERPVLNFLASYLYGTHKQGQPIVGPALVAAVVDLPDGSKTFRFLSKKEADNLHDDLTHIASNAYLLVKYRMEKETENGG